MYQLNCECKTDLLTLQCKNFIQNLVLKDKRIQGEERHRKCIPKYGIQL